MVKNRDEKMMLHEMYKNRNDGFLNMIKNSFNEPSNFEKLKEAESNFLEMFKSFESVNKDWDITTGGFYIKNDTYFNIIINEKLEPDEFLSILTELGYHKLIPTDSDIEDNIITFSWIL